MSTQVKADCFPMQASGATARYLRVAVDSNGKVGAAGATAASIGISDAEAFAANDWIAIRDTKSPGIHLMTAAGAFSVGDELHGAAGGKVDDAVTGNVVGTALEAATADGDVVRVWSSGGGGGGGAGPGGVYDDDVPILFGTGSDFQLLWSTANAHASADDDAVIALGNTSQSLHITDVAAKATDWNLAAVTDPTVYIHSNTTPATDYLSIGGHDGTTAAIDVVGGTILDLRIGGTDKLVVANTSVSLGSGVNLVCSATSEIDLSGVADALILDADNDTTISAPTDDQIDVEVGGGDVVTITATAFTFAATCYPVLPITDTDATVEGSLWYDASEDKLKFKTGAGVETVTSA